MIVAPPPPPPPPTNSSRCCHRDVVVQAQRRSWNRWQRLRGCHHHRRRTSSVARKLGLFVVAFVLFRHRDECDHEAGRTLVFARRTILTGVLGAAVAERSSRDEELSSLPASLLQASEDVISFKAPSEGGSQTLPLGQEGNGEGNSINNGYGYFYGIPSLAFPVDWDWPAILRRQDLDRLRRFLSGFKHAIGEKAWRPTRDLLQRCLRHRPPVGIVGLWLVWRFQRNVRRAIDSLEQENNREAGSQRDPPTSNNIPSSGGAWRNAWKLRKRAWMLDRGDDQYSSHGGVNPNRVLVCLSALSVDPGGSQGKTHGGSTASTDSARVTGRRLLLESLRATDDATLALSSATSSLTDYCRRLAIPLSRVEAIMTKKSPLSVPDTAKERPVSAGSATTGPPASRKNRRSSWNANTNSASTATTSIRYFAETTTNPDSAEDTTTTLPAAESVAYWACQVRMHDALLRLARNQLIRSASRLQRTERHWERRVRWSQLVGLQRQWWWRVPPASIWRRFWKRRSSDRIQDIADDGDWGSYDQHEQRRWWALAQASYRAEASKLGKVVSVLLVEPDDLDPELLIVQPASSSSKKNGDSTGDKGESQTRRTRDGAARLAEHQDCPDDATQSSAESGNPVDPREEKRRRWFLPRYSVRWVTEGKGHVSIRKLDASPSMWWTTMGGHGNRSDGSKTQMLARLLEGETDAVRRAQAWVQEARQVVSEVVLETIESSVDHHQHRKHQHRHRRGDLAFGESEAEREELFESWSNMSSSTPVSAGPASTATLTGSHREDQVLSEWNRVISYCDSLASWRRPGEGQVVKWWDFALVGWTKRLGIPTSYLYFRLAELVHVKIQPFIPSLREDLTEIVQTAWSIFQQRVLVPVKQIVLDVLNQNKGMMSAFSLDDEQRSLDRMLRDLGLADGSSDQRRLGLKHATEQYEQILQRGLLSNLIRGRLVRLMLIQVQQLKVGLLSALDTIDVLMQGNRIHFYALATVPSILLAYYSTRFFLRFLYSVRAKDPRPVSSAHSDMTFYLDSIERILLRTDSSVENHPRMGSTSRRIRLSPLELGELILCEHRYLLLLDFGSPPFPASECGRIHGDFQDLLRHPGMFYATSPPASSAIDLIHDQRLMAWLASIRAKHRALLESVY